MYTIGQAAEILKVTTHTLRYYEKEKIITPVRNGNGERLYDEFHLKWLKFVLKLKETQMPIAQIKEYTRLVREGEHTANERLKLLEHHQLSIQNQIDTLQSTDQMLGEKIAGYKELINK